MAKEPKGVVFELGIGIVEEFDPQVSTNIKSIFQN